MSALTPPATINVPLVLRMALVETSLVIVGTFTDGATGLSNQRLFCVAATSQFARATLRAPLSTLLRRALVRTFRQGEE